MSDLCLADLRADIYAAEGAACCLPDGHKGACLSFAARESRARAIRAVVAAQWGVACGLFCEEPWTHSFLPHAPVPAVYLACAALPTAEQIVDGVTT